MSNVTNPVTVLFQDSGTGQPVTVTADAPLPVDATVTAEIGDWAIATAVAPTLNEGDPAPGSVDLTGQMRVVDAASLAQLILIKAIIGSAADAAGANTVIGQLKQIALNTTPV